LCAASTSAAHRAFFSCIRRALSAFGVELPMLFLLYFGCCDSSSESEERTMAMRGVEERRAEMRGVT
ncbi:hypothetical protein PENTCL1PPCAC_29956, partial [Pristionchus entomophagus]